MLPLFSVTMVKHSRGASRCESCSRLLGRLSNIKLEIDTGVLGKCLLEFLAMVRGLLKIRDIEEGADDCVFVNCLEEFSAGV